MLVEGDNLQVLASLKPRYTGQVDVIYIDAPYNLGKDDFRYSDKRFHDPDADDFSAGSREQTTRLRCFLLDGQPSTGRGTSATTRTRTASMVGQHCSRTGYRAGRNVSITHHCPLSHMEPLMKSLQTLALVVGLASATGVGAASPQPASGTCFQGACFREFIVSIAKDKKSGVAVVKTRFEHYCNPGASPGCEREILTWPTKGSYNVQCGSPGYIEGSDGHRTPEPNPNPPHSIQTVGQLWTAVCSTAAH
jgi:hypothetical protein